MWRLALPVMLIFAVGSGVVMSIMFHLMAESIRNRGDRWLEAEVRSLAGDTESDHDLDPREDLKLKLEELRRHEFPISMESEDRAASLVFFARVSPTGILGERAIDGDPAVMREVIPLARSSADAVFWFDVVGGEYPLRVASASSSAGDLFVAGATPAADLELLEDIRDFALSGWLILLLVGALLSWLSTRRVLARVDFLAHAASEMDARSLGARLPTGGRRDEIGRMAVAFNGLLERIEEGVGHIRAMADAVAHDIRSPLTSIRAKLESALGDSSKRAEKIEGALAGIDRLSNIVSATLDVAEAEAGTLRAVKEKLDLSEMAGELIELYGALAAEKDISLVLERSTIAEYRCDPQLLRRAFANLLDNVLSHLPAGSSAWVRLYREGEKVVLEVEDSGPGFPPEVLDSVFERWVKGPDSRGSGLGLAVVRAVALAHGGRAEVHCAPGGGSIVRLVLPGESRIAPP